MQKISKKLQKLTVTDFDQCRCWPLLITQELLTSKGRRTTFDSFELFWPFNSKTDVFCFIFVIKTKITSKSRLSYKMIRKIPIYRRDFFPKEAVAVVMERKVTRAQVIPFKNYANNDIFMN